MPVSLSIKLDEAKLQKLKTGFEKFPKVFRREMRKELINISADIVKRAKKIHRFKTQSGNLERATQSKVDKRGLSVKFFIDDQLARYGKYIHEGTDPHKISVKSKKVLSNSKSGNFFGKTVNHPGIKADPYLRDKVEANIDQIQRAVEKAIDTASKESGLNG